MDRFVTRTPTWKTLNYSSMAAQQKKCAAKRTPAEKKPLQERQISEESPLSYHFEKRVVDLLHPSSQPNAENINGNSNDSGLSSASSVSPKIDDKTYDYNAIANKIRFTPVKNHSGKLADYIDCPVEKENDTYMTIVRTPASQEKKVDFSPQVQKPLEVNKQVNTPVNKSSNRLQPLANNMIMARIQRDLNSPSAAARIKAIKALKSPTKSAYNHFDIPDAEQSLRLPDPPSLQEIMRNIIVYVEVRSGEDNRSAGVRKVIEALGARVTLSLNRETTHVVFKDGLLSTFKKATQMNIPIVSILWIEACKNERRICDPKNFPISNLDRYVNPELYTKMKRVKSMQPDSECNKRIRAKAGGTPKEATPTQKTGYQKKTSTFIGGTPTTSKCKKKTDISQYFKKIEGGATPTSALREDSKITGTTTIQESPKTPLLNRVYSESCTTLNDSKKKSVSRQKIKDIQNYSDDSSSATKQRFDVKKSLNFIQAENTDKIIESSIRNHIVIEMQSPIEPSSVTKLRGRQRSCSLSKEYELETATNSMNTMAISSPKLNIRNRRSSIHTAKDMSVVFESPSKASTTIQPILEESSESEEIQVFSSKSVNERQTIYAAKTMDQTDLAKSENDNKKLETPNATRRRTLYTVQTIQISEIKEKINNKLLSNVSNRRRTCLNPRSLEQIQILEITDSKAKNTPDTELVENSKIIDLTNEVERNIQPTKIADKTPNSRRTLCGGHKICETNKNALQISSPNSTTGLSVCQTPISFQTRRVASSTLLDDSENMSKLVTTPTADATTGKLLEETEQCHTPLIFSSTRRPGNSRRSVFDASMDIITQRLQCINQSARRSLAPPTPSADVVNALDKSTSKPVVIQKSNHLLNSKTPNSSTEALNDNANNNNNNNNNGTDDLLPTTYTSKTKRKLFAPNEMPSTPTPLPPPPTLSVLPIKSVEISDKRELTKRRRTLMPISQPQPTTTTTVSHNSSTTSTDSTPKIKKRRSTLDFEQLKNNKPKAVNSVQTSSSDASVAANSSQKQTNAKKTPVLVYTNMHQQQIDVIREAINKLGVFVLENSVTNATTHLVSLEPRRTLNLLRALARGCWILDYSWISDSLAAGRWLPEESHELKSFSKAVELCRSEHQAFGSAYKNELFRKIGAFYISSQCCPLNKENMRELITLCGGSVVSNRQKARFIIGDPNKKLEDKLYLTPFWVLDCITQMQILKVNKYMYSISEGKSAPKSIPLQEKD